MEVGRIAIGLGFFGLAALSFASFTVAPETITITNARLHPMGENLAFVAGIKVPGSPDRLTGAGSDSAAQVSLVDGPFALPANSKPSLAMDGVHVMLSGIHGDVAEGRLIPVTLWFEQAGRISTRARVDMATMDHNATFEPGNDEPRPKVEVRAEKEGETWRVTLETQNFEFSKDAVDGPHQPGIGHGHLYLDGLKLQRVYAPDIVIGALPKGEYELHVVLNTNDHRAYLVDGQLVSASVTVTVD